MPTLTIPALPRLAPQPSRVTAGSRRPWLWISAALLVAAVLGGSLVWSATTSALQHLTRSGPVPLRYTLALIHQDYAAAYHTLDRQATLAGQPLTAAAFAAQGRARDAQAGPIQGVVVEPQRTATALTLTVQRPTGAYTVHLRLRGQGAAQRIEAIDRL